MNTADAILGTLQSPNEVDSNSEPANVVDGLYAIARAIEGHAQALRDLTETLIDLTFKAKEE